MSAHAAVIFDRMAGNPVVDHKDIHGVPGHLVWWPSGGNRYYVVPPQPILSALEAPEITIVLRTKGVHVRVRHYLAWGEIT